MDCFSRFSRDKERLTRFEGMGRGRLDEISWEGRNQKVVDSGGGRFLRRLRLGVARRVPSRQFLVVSFVWRAGFSFLPVSCPQ